MSLTLGEKLRQAREERGLSLSEIADQTRISSLYLESIENDDYKTLPGGIFNKGFVKSYAKFVGLNEQEALMDYSRLLAESEGSETADLKTYRPEVLINDQSSSMIPTVIVAAIILALMTLGILYGVRYLRQPSEPTVANISSTNINANLTSSSNTNTDDTAGSVPDMATLKVEFRALTQPVKVIATIDGQEPQPNNVTAGSSVTFTPKERLTLNYLRWNAPAIELTINGKPIALPQSPLEAKDRDRIVFTISNDNLAQIWALGAIRPEEPGAQSSTNANISVNATQPGNSASTPPRPTPKPPAPANVNTGTKPTPQDSKPKPSPTRRVIVVGNANRPE